MSSFGEKPPPPPRIKLANYYTVFSIYLQKRVFQKLATVGLPNGPKPASLTSDTSLTFEDFRGTVLFGTATVATPPHAHGGSFPGNAWIVISVSELVSLASISTSPSVRVVCHCVEGSLPGFRAPGEGCESRAHACHLCPSTAACDGWLVCAAPGLCWSHDRYPYRHGLVVPRERTLHLGGY